MGRLLLMFAVIVIYLVLISLAVLFYCFIRFNIHVVLPLILNRTECQNLQVILHMDRTTTRTLDTPITFFRLSLSLSLQKGTYACHQPGNVFQGGCLLILPTFRPKFEPEVRFLEHVLSPSPKPFLLGPPKNYYMGGSR